VAKKKAGKTSTKKTPTRSRGGGSAASKKKAAARKKPVRKASSKKTTTKKKSGSKKKTSTRKKVTKKAPSKKTTTKKKASTKKAATSKKKVTKKAPSKKTPARKTSTKKKTSKKAATAKKVSKKAPSKKKTVSKKKTESKKKTTTKKTTSAKKKTTTRGKRGRGRSVAEVASTSEADAQGYVYINGRRVRMISTAGIVKKKKSRTSKAKDAAEAQAKPKKIKTHLGAKELRHYRNLLLLKLKEITGDLSAMEEQALRSAGGDISHMPIHMADIGSDTFDQDFMLGLAESERQRIRDIEHALKRIDEKTYGVCQMTGEEIPKARLDAKPWAKYTIEAARKLEGQWGSG
jgi:DnaK suppressor protein